MIELDAIDPQKTFSFYVPGKTIGKIRYKGSDISSRCDKGISFIWSSLSMGVQTPTVATIAPTVIMNSRLCFYRFIKFVIYIFSFLVIYKRIFFVI